MLICLFRFNFANHRNPGKSYLEDHPRICKWLITMVSKAPKDRVVGPIPNGLSVAYKWG